MCRRRVTRAVPKIRGMYRAIVGNYRIRDKVLRRARVLVWKLAASLVICSISFLAVHASFVETANTFEPPRVANICGPNALLMFLVLCERDELVDDQIMDGIPCNTNGASLLQLRDICNSLGLPCEIRQYHSSEMDRMPLPALIHSRRSSGAPHYFVVYQMTPDGFLALDGTTAKEFQISKERMADYFTGYAIVRKRSFLLRYVIFPDWFHNRLNWMLIAANTTFFLWIGKCISVRIGSQASSSEKRTVIG